MYFVLFVFDENASSQKEVRVSERIMRDSALPYKSKYSAEASREDVIAWASPNTTLHYAPLKSADSMTTIEILTARPVLCALLNKPVKAKRILLFRCLQFLIAVISSLKVCLMRR